MHLATFSFAVLVVVIGAKAEQLPFPLQPLQFLEQNLNDYQHLQHILSNDINGAVYSSNISISSPSTYLPFLPPVSPMCSGALFSLFFNPDKTTLMQMIDAMGKPASGILQGAVKWPGNFDQCVGLGMTYCWLQPTTKGSPPPGPNPLGGAYWGTCVPQQCNITDAAVLGNWALQTLLPIIASKLPLPSFQNATMMPGRCQSAENPAPDLSPGIIFFLVILVWIGILTVLGTAYDYLVVELGCGKESQSMELTSYQNKHEFNFKRMEDEMVKDGVMNGESVNGDAVKGEPVNGGVVKGGINNSIVKQKAEHSMIIKFLLCFSMISNGKKILSLAPASDNIGCINGIRFLSLTWVILGHWYAFGIVMMSNPAYIYKNIATRVTFQPIINGTLSVDSFFVLSGLLTAYIFFKRNGDKSESHSKRMHTVLLMYLHRYLRLTPALGILMGFDMLLPLYMTSGPNAATEESLKGTCDTYWWYNILYINNFVKDAGKCVGHVWYLANDMQFFLLSPIILYTYKIHKIAGHIMASVFWLISIGSNIGITASGKYGITFGNQGEGFMFDIYTKPYTRIGPYVIGMVAGYLLYQYRKENRRPSWVTAVLWWIISAVCALSVTYGLSDYYKYGKTPSKAADVLHISFSRSAWGITIAWLVLACATGRAGPINTLLSWTPFGPVSRINYSAYLYHLLVGKIIILNTRSFVAFNDYLMATLYCGILLLSYGVGFLTALWFESPFIGLEKLIF